MPQIVTDQNGVEHEFPDEATPEMIARALNAEPPASQTPARARGVNAATGAVNDAGIPGYIPYAVNMTAYTAQELRRGLTNLAGLPVDLATLALNLGARGVNAATGAEIRPITNPVGGSDFLFNATGGFGLLGPEVTPQDAATQVVGRVGQEIGASVLPGAGLVRAGGRIGAEGARQMAVQGDTLAKRLVAPMIEQAAANPSRFVANEAATAAGVGAGAGLAGAAVNAAGLEPGSAGAQVADLTGGLIGGLSAAGAMAAAPAIRNTAQAIIAPTVADPENKATAVEVLAKAYGLQNYNKTAGVAPSTENLANAIRAGNRPGQVIDGFEETLADRLRNPGVAALQYGREAGPANAEFAIRRDNNIGAVAGAMRQAAPQGNEGALLDAIRRGVDTQVADVTRMADDTALRAEQAAAGVRPALSPEARGGAIRGALQSAEDAAQDAVGKAYAQVADTANRPVDGKTLKETLSGVTAGLTEAEKTLAPTNLIQSVAGLSGPPTPTGLLDFLGAPIMRDPEPVPLRQITSLRTTLLERQRAALKDPTAERGGRNVARVIGQYVQAIEGLIDNALTPDERTAIASARNLAFQRAETFGRQGSPVAAVLAEREGGRPFIPDARVAPQFVSPNAAQPLDELLKAADTPDVRAAIRDEILSRASTATEGADTIRQFMDDYAIPLQKFPGVRGELLRVADERGTQAMAGAQRDETVSRLTNPARSAVARVGSYSPEKLPDAMRSVIAARDPAAAADEVLSFVGNAPDAVAGARKAFWDVLKKNAESNANTTGSVSGEKAWNGAALDRFLSDPSAAAVAQRLWRDDPAQLDRIKQIAETLRSVNVSGRTRAPNTSGTAQGLATNNLLTPETIFSRYADVQRGRISAAFFVGSTLAVALRRATASRNFNAVGQLVDEMLLNPDLAEKMLREYNPANVQAAKRAAKLYLPNRVSHVVETIDQEDEQDPVVKALKEGARP